MIYLLDTDHLSIIQDDTRPGHRTLLRRLTSASREDICTTIVSLQEQMQGWLAFLARARSSAQIIIAYNELEEMFRSYCEMKVLRYSDDAEDRFVALRKKRVRIGSMDLRIAAIALSHGAIVLTRNVTDFRQVPGLVVEDWTA